MRKFYLVVFSKVDIFQKNMILRPILSRFMFKVEDKSLTWNITFCKFLKLEFMKKSSDHFKDIYKVKLLTSFDVYMTSFLKGVPNYVLNH